MKYYLRILIRFGLIRFFNLRLTKPVENFYASLGNTVEFKGYHLPTRRLILFPNKPFTGEKYRNYFNIRRKGIAIEEIIGTFIVVGESKILKVRINIAPLLLAALLFFFLFITVPMAVININESYTYIPEVCIGIFFVALVISVPLLFLALIMKYSVKGIKKMLITASSN